jgi:cyanophycinase
MGSQVHRTLPGAVALVGSGEYLDAMNEVDTYLLESVGGAKTATVALLPTASGLELNGPTSWNKLGLKHFQNLGVHDVRATHIVDRESANDPEQVELLKGVDFYYFSGGNPQHTIESLRDSAAWEVINAAYEQGAVLAGCSAGAMMLSGRTLSIRQVMMGGKTEFVESMGIVPELIVFPHFDRMAGFLDQTRFQQLQRAVPEGNIIVGIDEETALVRIAPPTEGSTGSRWRVMGRQTVKVFVKEKEPLTLQAGEEIDL